jgi:RNA-binding protein YlmH
MAKVEKTVTSDLDGARLDKAIVALVEGASRAKVKRAIDEGEVRVNGRVLAKGALVKRSHPASRGSAMRSRA